MPPPTAARRAPAIVIVLLLAIFAGVMLRNRGPQPKLGSAAASEFSAERALRFHRAVFRDVPHPVGSAEHDAVLGRLVAQFRALGYDTSIEQAFACNPSATCATVANVIAQHPAAAPATGDVLLLTAHYDSVGAGPGASDDGIGVATMLEVARALRNEPLRNRVTFLITDAEEEGLIGAEGFVADSAASRGAAAVINVEARGTTGSSFLFETSRQNRWLLPIVTRALPWPATSSFFFSIYELLPNDTDLTVFKRAGYAGLNFANIGSVAHYHTSLDDFAHLSPRLLQHDGDHVLAMARALGNAELRPSSNDNAVWFDVLQFFLLWWPQRWCLGLSILMLAILIAAAAVRVREAHVSARMITAGVASFFVATIGALVVGTVALLVITWRATGPVWVAQPGPWIASMWLIGIATAIVMAKRFYAHADFDGLFLGHTLCWCVLSISLSLVLPGASYLAIVPAATLAIGAVVRAARDTAGGWLVIASAAVTAVLHFPLAVTLYDAIGRPVLPIIAMHLALIATTFTPLIAAAEIRRALVNGIVAVAIAFLAMAAFLPSYSKESPRRLSLHYIERADGAQWDADELTPDVRKAAAFDVKPFEDYPWTRRVVRTWRAPAPALGLPPVSLRVVSDVAGPQRKLSLLLSSARRAPRMAIIFHAPSLQAMRINGIEPAPQNPRHYNPLAAGWHRIAVYGVNDARIDLTLGTDAPIEFIASDATYGLPPSGAALVSARSRSVAVPSDEGDTTVTMRRMQY